MLDLPNYTKTETLKNGTQIRIRAIRPDDKKRISDGFKHLDPESVYTRFFYFKKALTDEDLATATEVDFDRVVALVATIGDADRETIIGAGRYETYETPAKLLTAEVAFTVADNYHNQGMATLILRHLTGIARVKGVAQFEADVLSKNLGMLAVFSHSGLPMQTRRDGSTVHVTLSLTRDAS